MSRTPSPKLLAFRTHYLEHGNATRAAREAKYKNPNKKGPKLAHHPVVRAALEAKQGVALNRALADRAERRGFWAKTMRDPTLDYQHRLKASELDAKSEGDFIERLEIGTPATSIDFSGITTEELRQAIELYPNNGVNGHQGN
jgi:hypothetical protein